MAPKRKRKPAAKATAPKPEKEANGDISPTPADRTVLRNGTRVSKRPILTPRRPKRKPTAPRGATASNSDAAATAMEPPVVLLAVTNLPPTPADSATRTCRACGISKPCTDWASEFPSRSDLPFCQHPAHHTCRSCLVEHIAKLWIQPGLKEIACPECRAPIQLRTVEQFCGPQIRQRYILLTRGRGRVPEVHPLWRWYLQPLFSAGRTHHDARNPVVTCGKCGAKTCFRHRVRWHEEYTCAEFDDKAAVDIERSERLIRFVMAKCPSCGFSVEKSAGCNIMECRCGAFRRYATGLQGV